MHRWRARGDGDLCGAPPAQARRRVGPSRPMLGAVGAVVVLLVAPLATLAVLLARSQPAPAAQLHVGQMAPGFRLPSARGGNVALAQEARHIVLLAFLQTQPDTAVTVSRDQEVVVQSMARQHAVQGLRTLVVDASVLATGQQPAAQDLLNTTYDWQLDQVPLLRDADGATARRYGVARLPTTLLLGPDGRVARRWEGYVLAAQVDQAIQAFLGGPMADRHPFAPMPGPAATPST